MSEAIIAKKAEQVAIVAEKMKAAASIAHAANCVSCFIDLFIIIVFLFL